MIRHDVRYFASELDDGRYVNVPATARDDFRFGEIKVFRQM